MLAVKGVYDGQVVRLLEPIKVDRPCPVEVTFVEEIARTPPAAGADNLDRFIGIWADFTPEEDKVFQSIMEERAGYFANRQFDDLLAAASTSLDFWDNALDDEDWNEVRG